MSPCSASVEQVVMRTSPPAKLNVSQFELGCILPSLPPFGYSNSILSLVPYSFVTVISVLCDDEVRLNVSQLELWLYSAPLLPLVTQIQF